MKLIDALNWRYATKKMNGQQIPAEKLNTILEAIKLAPSSLGLTPYKVIVIDLDIKGNKQTYAPSFFNLVTILNCLLL